MRRDGRQSSLQLGPESPSSPAGETAVAEACDGAKMPFLSMAVPADAAPDTPAGPGRSRHAAAGLDPGLVWPSSASWPRRWRRPSSASAGPGPGP